MLPGSSLCIICAALRHSEGRGCLWKYLCELLPAGQRSEKLLHTGGIQKQRADVMFLYQPGEVDLDGDLGILVWFVTEMLERP